MKIRSRCLLTIAGVLSLAGCSSTDVNTYAGKQPTITVQDFYRSPVAGYGFFQDNSGEVVDRYYVTLVPQWHGNEGTLHEKQWNDQGKLFFEQTWNITFAEDKRHFTATSNKVDGVATGEASGYALHMVYTLLSPRENGDTISLAADDWTYLQPDGTGINKVALHKYGYHVGDVIYTLRPLAKGEKLNEGYGAK